VSQGFKSAQGTTSWLARTMPCSAPCDSMCTIGASPAPRTVPVKVARSRKNSALVSTLEYDNRMSCLSHSGPRITSQSHRAVCGSSWDGIESTTTIVSNLKEVWILDTLSTYTRLGLGLMSEMVRESAGTRVKQSEWISSPSGLSVGNSLGHREKRRDFSG